MKIVVLVVLALALLAVAAVALAIRSRNMQIWLGSYLRRRPPPRPPSKIPTPGPLRNSGGFDAAC